jgi:hypothetical protein
MHIMDFGRPKACSAGPMGTHRRSPANNSTRLLFGILESSLSDREVSSGFCPAQSRVLFSVTNII